MEYDLKIVGELTLKIRHNLIGIRDASLESIKRVYSHPQVFERCKKFLDEHRDWDLIATKDTVQSAQRVLTNNNPEEAAIGSFEAAHLYGLSILKEGIETSPHNFTRFVVISHSNFLEGPKDKSSIIYAVDDSPGALYETLKIFYEKNCNILKILFLFIRGNFSLKAKLWKQQ